MPLRTLAPPMPAAVQAYLTEDYGELDADIEPILDWMKEQKVFHEFAHGRDPFIVHLRGTWGILRCWNQPIDTARCGLLHSAYTRDGFFFRLFDIEDPQSRARLAGLLGERAEEQIFKYCYTETPMDLAHAWGGTPAVPDKVVLGEPLDPSGYDVPSRIHGGRTIHMSAKDMANYSVVFVADIMDQWQDVNTYAHVYHFDAPERIWPGTGVPNSPMSLLSKLLRTARPYLDEVPPVFNSCTEVLSLGDEQEATRLYWKAVQGEHSMTADALEGLFRRAAEHNPYIGEPHAMLGQLLHRRGAYAEAAHHAICAIDLFQQWATCWDKRVPWAQWLGFSRMLLLRAKRREAGLSLLPSVNIHHGGMEEPGATYLQDLRAAFHEYTEEAGVAGARAGLDERPEYKQTRPLAVQAVGNAGGRSRL